MRVAVILPTYNERETLPPLLRRLAEVALSAGFSCEAVVVDDASPDGTAEAAQALAGELRDTLPVTVVRRTGKLGLASAVLEGVERSTADVVVVMDGDGSHPPELVPRLVAAVAGGADVAVGSRYVAGGGVARWPLARRALSWGATRLARTLFGIPVRDPVSGFFAARRQAFTGEPLRGVGYKILLEVLVTRPDLRVVEVPYVFVDRRGGRSKLGTGEVVNYLRLLGYLLRRRRARMGRGVA